MNVRKIILELPGCSEHRCQDCKFQHRGPPRNVETLAEGESDFYWLCDLFCSPLEGGKERLRCAECMDAEISFVVREQMLKNQDSGGVAE